MDVKFYAGNLDKLKIQRNHGGSERITPFLIFQAGMDTEDEDDTGEVYIQEIVDALEGKLEVPYFVTTMPISIYIVAEVG